MSGKTKEITLLNLKLSLFEFYNKNEEGKGSGYPGRLIQSFCDQEKRSTAIAFQDWIKKKGYWQDDEYNYWKSAKSKYIIAKSTTELYDLYINSL